MLDLRCGHTSQGSDIALKSSTAAAAKSGLVHSPPTISKVKSIVQEHDGGRLRVYATLRAGTSLFLGKQ